VFSYAAYFHIGKMEEEALLDLSAVSFAQFREISVEKDEKKRLKLIDQFTKKKACPENVLQLASMGLLGDLVMILLFTFGVPGAAFSIPIIFVLIWFFIGLQYAIGIFILILVPLGILEAPARDGALSSWPAYLLLKYFSFKVISETQLSASEPCILVAPPHGLFPFGNIATMVAFPPLMGFSFRGLAASAALAVPGFKQLMCPIGCISASRISAESALLVQKKTIGISTGGVAEVFETHNGTNSETILLKCRKGLIKLAIRTGAPLVPCYVFGNTQLYSIWTGGPCRAAFLALSRKIGFATVLFWGRAGTPVPYRRPLLGVMGTPIRVERCAVPDDAEVDRIQAVLCQRMVALFDKHKAKYGWEDKQLIIK
jgi:2-acylglycerol O-acyltransferase 2